MHLARRVTSDACPRVLYVFVREGENSDGYCALFAADGDAPESVRGLDDDEKRALEYVSMRVESATVTVSVFYDRDVRSSSFKVQPRVNERIGDADYARGRVIDHRLSQWVAECYAAILESRPPHIP